MDLKEHLQRNGKTDSWINLANQFQVKGTNKQKSDYVRGLFKKIQRVKVAAAEKFANRSEKFAADSYCETFRNDRGELDLIYVDYCQTVGPDGKLPPQPEYVITTSGAVGSTAGPYYGDRYRIGDFPDQPIDWNKLVQPVYTPPYHTGPQEPPALEKIRLDKQKQEWEEFNKWKAGKESIQKKQLQPYLNGDINNVLFIGDLHLPFTAEGYLEFCRKQQERFNCGTVIYAGDLLDNHAQSFHNTDADGLSAKDELNLAIKQLEEWYRVFPKAIVLLGNHDRIVARKLFSVGLSQRWMKPLGEVLNTPNYNYVEQYVFNNVLYVHGEGGTALKKAQNELMSVACGHSHSEGYVQFINGGKNFAMQVGCGIDFNSYAFAYAQRGKLPVLSCGAILNQSPILIPFI